MLRKLTEDDIKMKKFKTESFNMYSQALDYANIWTKQLEQFNEFSFMDLKTIPKCI